MKALVTGATGFVGSELVKRLDSPAVLSRNPDSAAARGLGARPVSWEPEVGPPPSGSLEGIDTVFHLAGDPVAKGRWTRAKKARIRSSRVNGTRHLVDALIGMDPRPRCLVSASAVGFYGDRNDAILEESEGPDNSFLAKVCQAWEGEALRAEEHGIRVVTPRIGIVLGAGGGALKAMLPPFRFGVGGRLGNGRQWMPWIHLDDLVRLLVYVAGDEDVRGSVNAVSPAPVTNRDFTRVLAKVLHRPAMFPVPGFVLRVVLGEFSTVLLGSQRAVPRALTRSGFEFKYPDLPAALGDILG